VIDFNDIMGISTMTGNAVVLPPSAIATIGPSVEPPANAHPSPAQAKVWWSGRRRRKKTKKRKNGMQPITVSCSQPEVDGCALM
jgi:hypothetical protein